MLHDERLIRPIHAPLLSSRHAHGAVSRKVLYVTKIETYAIQNPFQEEKAGVKPCNSMQGILEALDIMRGIFHFERL